MTPDDLARLHPRLFHVTAPGTAERLDEHGLLSARQIVERTDLPADERERTLATRRDAEVRLTDRDGLPWLLNDNLPLNVAALERCLDDGLAPDDWLRILNARVFFWPTDTRLQTLLNARTNRDREREVLVFDTRALAAAHAERMELSPINGGVTIRKAARRGLATYTPLSLYDYRTWRRLRGGFDAVAEIAIRGGVPDAARHLLDVRRVMPAAR